MSKNPDLVDALLKPEAYSHRPQKIELAQTQMSFIFLTGDLVYKIKKPVNLGYLDYTTLEKRHFFCNQEVELNQRLSPDVYLEVTPITRSERIYRIGGQGEIVEYAVKMRQLPSERMMDQLLLRDMVSPEMIKRVAEKLAAFHAEAITSPEISAFGSLEAIKVNTDENFSQTAKYIGNSITDSQYNRIKKYSDTFLKSNRTLFQERISTGRIRDCHGDLHAAHVCLSNGIYIYDCIEFNDRFRYGDVASEVAFLAMDLDRYGRTDLSQAFVNAYVNSSQDTGINRLLHFYKCYRAYVRGKVESFKLDDPYISEKDKVRAAAQTYFNLAYRYTREKPIVLIMTGLVGTGKSTVAEMLSRGLGFNVISSDVTRKKLAGIPPTEHRFEQFEGGIYTEDFSRKTYNAMFSQAREFLLQGNWIILDASFKKREDRLKAGELAKKANADFVIVECVLDRDTVKKRLEERLKQETTSDGRWEIYESQKRDFEPVTESLQHHIVLDTSQPESIIVKKISEKIL